MIYFFTPYSFELKLLDAIAAYMELLQMEDWAVILDGDTAFLNPDFGHQIKTHIENHPTAGLFTSYASRCHYRVQVPRGRYGQRFDPLPKAAGRVPRIAGIGKSHSDQPQNCRAPDGYQKINLG
ncbi:MAG: hypothetical protein D4R64_05565 [Porphyromonadaceae bacterium]|nr:MAG: hypothetical protein D4R64_05565 [Porphyromonadaceae bacterium]